MKKPQLPDALRCCGCGACANSCPAQAIAMIPDVEGFLQPRIDEQTCIQCGLCEKTCPVLHPKYNNTPKPDCFALAAADDVRMSSSSGGVFSILSEEILRQGGTVFGAAWQSDWTISHQSADSADGLGPLRGSKYLQSDTGMTYRQAKEILEQGKPVLYSGCPCQIAGLYSFLRKDYPLLYTAEIICHGVPSPKAFRKYLQDNFSEKPIKRIDFRDKSVFKWSTTSNIYFQNGEEYHKNEREDPYLKAFLPCMILRKSCASCSFSKLPRQADITMGDFWGCEKFHPGINDRKGISAVLINSSKGHILFDRVRKAFPVCIPTTVDAITHVNKTIIHPFRPHSGRKHFFSSMEAKPFNQLVEDSLTHHYDVGIVGLWYGINYGSVLTYYALYHVVKSLGYDPVMLPKPNNMWTERFNRPDTIAQSFVWKHCNVLNPFKAQADYLHANALCDNFLLGSDVVWNYDICGKEAGHYFFLDWVKAGRRKIGYACSCGDRASLDGPEDYLQIARYCLRKMDAISVREEPSVGFLSDFCGRRDIRQVLDPVFLCSREHYCDIAASADPADATAPFVFAYLLNGGEREQKLSFLDIASAHYAAACRVSGNPNAPDLSAARYGDRVLPVISVESWLNHMKNCQFFFGDSYHGLCFALIFHRPFAIFFGKNDRVDSLLKLVGLEDRKLTKACTTHDMEALLSRPIDWDDVDARLAKIREESIQWLQDALRHPVAEPTDTELLKDAFMQKLSDLEARLTRQENTIRELRETCQSLKKQRRSLNDRFHGGIRCCREHGFAYTCRYALKRIVGRLGGKHE